MRVCSIVGARPQFIKAAMVSRALVDAGIEEVLIHTGQHYDDNLNRIFFEELRLPPPQIHLGVGSGTHAEQTGLMMIRLEAALRNMKPAPDWVLIYGDTNSTLVGALVASKLKLPLAHVEAGLRSFNRTMPEEINRVVADHLSQLLFAPTPTAVENLRREGITRGVHLTGDVMQEAVWCYARRAQQQVPLTHLTGHAPGQYYLATVHRAENTDNPVRLQGIFEGLGRLELPVILPLHPRTRARLDGSIRIPANVELRKPVGYLAMLTLVQHARAVLTDSGGLQKEAVWLGVPCITLRDETEWIETLEGGWNQLVGADPERIAAAAHRQPTGPAPTLKNGAEAPSQHIVRLLQG
ncbi:non-hydrolyzing UDP-N-acetylglucosamine 2-epimerase [Rhodothermus profundi]|uniref:UDP-GlcNAc3NAcA epimerase n=1 Tax=Rhodothermus profundi TaxID=633813 RepID=A0A1M6Q7U5_9BACT|nr:UDP-N-acetylglucosamine 2-epimerase (non-hydrolyzing) [Rhodothermus profundi]SHK16349.1 UDP-GlcNAc3NAcA epimerase [Rhodothermus profundi]